MVQTEDQYMFVYDAILEGVTSGEMVTIVQIYSINNIKRDKQSAQTHTKVGIRDA